MTTTEQQCNPFPLSTVVLLKKGNVRVAFPLSFDNVNVREMVLKGLRILDRAAVPDKLTPFEKELGERAFDSGQEGERRLSI